MKLCQGFFIAVLVCIAAIAVRADGIPSDARIIVGHGGDPKKVGSTFLVPVNSSGGSDSGDDFENGSATENIVELIFTAKLGNSDTINCVAPDFYFGHCTVIPGKGHKVTIIFDDPLAGGIPPGDDFFIGLNDPGKKTGSWKKDGVKDLDAQAIFAVSTPEPGTLLLLLGGLGSIWLRRKREPSPETHV
jgi:hypothetical protein